MPAMLPRTRSLQRRVFLSSIRNSTIRPNLCPTHSLTTGTRGLLTRPSQQPWRTRTTPALNGTVQQRLLATAMDDPLGEVPFRSPGYTSTVPSPPLYNLRPFDPATPLHISAPVDHFPRSRATPRGVPGGIEEMFSVFDVCLAVDKLDRAALVLERFGYMQVLPPADLLALHNRYLRANLSAVFKHSNADWANDMHKWYEKQIRNAGLPQTPETIACMLKVSLLSSQGNRLERLISRYLDVMPDEESIYHVLSEEEILNSQDMGKIISIYQPASKLSLEEVEVTADKPLESDAIDQQAPAKTLEADNIRTPDVLGVDQKGMGLRSLREILSFFKDIEDRDLSQLPLAERMEIQARLERDCVEAALSRWREESQQLTKIGRASAANSPALSQQLYDWHCSLETKLTEEFALINEAEDSTSKSSSELDRCAYGPFLRQTTPERLAAVTILGTLNSIAGLGADKGVPLAQMLATLGKCIEDDIKLEKRSRALAERKRVKRRQFRQQAPASQHDVPATPEVQGPPTRPVQVEAPLYDNEMWPSTIRIKLAAVVLSALIESAKINVVREHPETKALVSQIQPAMAHTTVLKKGKKIGVLMPNKFLTDMMKREPRGDFLARHLPMLVEPKPWSGFEMGGFLEFPASLVRVKNGEREQKVYAKAAAERGDLEQVMKGLDVLGRTGWRVNTPVFDVMLKAWNDGKPLANIPALHPDIAIPPEPEMSDDPSVRRAWLKAVKAADNERSGLHSQRCYMNFQLEIARSFRNQTFYFPHNMDFRGRAYPLPTYLNHMGADHVRGLLRFDKGKELGEAGLRWLKVHLSNVFGFDKASLAEREQFAVDHYDDIVDSVSNPLEGKRWWLKAEDPWQCLAACYELKSALDCEDPTKFVSHLPVHQDGTCNGLQHYAALGGDTWGAQQVNLLPGDRPADVYSAVADLVKQSIAVDVKEGNFLAKAMDGKITRKVVKQTVMTNVYGVTYIGAKAQIEKQLVAAYPKLAEEHEVSFGLLASYVATKVFKALGTMFRGAHDIQYWLGECAGRVCRSLTTEQLDRIIEPTPTDEVAENKKPRATLRLKNLARGRTSIDDLLSLFRSTIVWTTPLRMPIAQPYRKDTTRSIETCLQDLHLSIPERSDPVNRRKQLQAFPPNFIHSLDASHMLLSALECDEKGLSFAAVHDSFWTHAGDVDVMNRVLRDSFIRIHSEDVIGRLAAEFNARYKGSMYLTHVGRSSPLGKEIMALRKKTGLTLRQELEQERERMKLMQSSKPADVKKAKKMVTPGSLVEDNAAHAPSLSDEVMNEVGLGNIPGETVPASNEPPESLVFEDVESVQAMMESSQFELALEKGTKPKKKKVATGREGTLQVWLPLTFPEIPKKGDFDVALLKDSKYFFS